MHKFISVQRVRINYCPKPTVMAKHSGSVKRSQNVRPSYLTIKTRLYYPKNSTAVHVEKEFCCRREVIKEGRFGDVVSIQTAKRRSMTNQASLKSKVHPNWLGHHSTTSIQALCKRVGPDPRKGAGETTKLPERVQTLFGGA